MIRLPVRRSFGNAGRRRKRAADTWSQQFVCLAFYVSREPILAPLFSIPNLAIAKCNSNTGTVLQYSKTPSLRVVSFEDECDQVAEGKRALIPRSLNYG
jgi:hypothetical protein